MRNRGIGAHELTQRGIAICLFPEQPPIVKTQEKYEEEEDDFVTAVKTNKVFAAAPTKSDEDDMFENRITYIVAFMSFCLSLHNVYYFPLNMFRFGGGSFFVAYTIMSFFFAYPLHFLQTFVGQYGRCGIVKIWDMSPLARGVGWAMALSAILVCVLYTIYASYAMIYLANGLFLYTPPWYDCQESEREKCAPRICRILPGSHDDCPFTPAQDYFYGYVVKQNRTVNPLLTAGMGYPLWWLILGLFYPWFVVFVCCREGVKSLSRAAPILMIFPYFGLTTLFVLGLQLDGSFRGLSLMFTVDHKFFTFGTWYFAAIQICNELGVTHGVPLVYGRFCHPQHLCQFDSLYICIINYVTSVMCAAIMYCCVGNLSADSDSDFKGLFMGDVGFLYTTYSETLSRVTFSALWYVITFLTLFCVVVGTINGLVLTLTVVLFDLSTKLRKIRGLVAFSICWVFFLIGILFCFDSGFVVTHLLDEMPIFRTALLFVGLFVLAIVYFYTLKRVNADCYELLEFTPFRFPQFCLYVAPIILLILCLAGLIGARVPDIGSVYYSLNAFIIWGWVPIILVFLVIIAFVIRWFIISSNQGETGHVFDPAESWGQDRGEGVGSSFKNAFMQPWTTKE